MARFIDCSMLAAGLVLVLVACLCLVNSGGRFACWFKSLLACFDALSRVSHARARRNRQIMLL